MKELKRVCSVASGREKAQVVLKNANIINVFTEEIEVHDIAIEGGIIAGVGCYDGRTEIDLSGKYVCPGFIDAHMHIESTMVMPSELSNAVLKSGTTALIADPHEIVNVCGSKGIDFFLAATENVLADFYFMLPSSVPATKLETNGSDFTSEDMKQYISHPRVLGIGEVMCFNDVVNCEDEIMKKLTLYDNKMIDGHAPNLTGEHLQAYVCAGIKTEHECVSFEDAYQKVKAGLKILVREGSAAKNLEAIISGMISSGIPPENFMFCTDDKHLDDIEAEGHIRWNIKKAVDLGLDPIVAIKMASYYTAKTYGLKRTGAVAAGYKADLVVLDNLKDLNVLHVYKNGIIVGENSISKSDPCTISKSITSSVRFDDISKESISLKAYKRNYVIEMVPNQILTKCLYEPVPQENDFFVPNGEYSKLCVVERHGRTGCVAVAPFKGFKIQNGAIATSVSHDSHNVIAAGDNDDDIVVAVNRLKQLQGGYVIVSGGQVAAELQLEVAGLISTMPANIVQKNINHMIALARSFGVPREIDPFITLSFMALPVIPEIRLTNFGLVDTHNMRLL